MGRVRIQFLIDPELLAFIDSMKGSHDSRNDVLNWWIKSRIKEEETSEFDYTLYDALDQEYAEELKAVEDYYKDLFKGFLEYLGTTSQYGMVLKEAVELVNIRIEEKLAHEKKNLLNTKLESYKELRKKNDSLYAKKMKRLKERDKKMYQFIYDNIYKPTF